MKFNMDADTLGQLVTDIRCAADVLRDLHDYDTDELAYRLDEHADMLENGYEE